MSRQLTRRDMLRNTALGGVGAWLAAGSGPPAAARSPNEKLNIAVIGCGGRGVENVRCVAHENIVALCDVDERRAAKTFRRYPKAKKFHDFRRMFDQMHKQIDAVMVTTPDHTHAAASITAMELGKHVYCEKPLTRTVYESRRMAQTAAKQKVITQMGTHHHWGEGYRRAVEVIQSGALGAIRQVHCSTSKPSWPQGIDRPKDTPPVPPTLKWDLWLGPAPRRPYHPAYVPFKWRGWWDFGTGALGDLGIHVSNVAFWALKLGAPTSVEVIGRSDVKSETAPKWSIIRYQFAAREKLPPVTLTWYDGQKYPPPELAEGRKLTHKGVTLFIGDKGKAIVPIAAAPGVREGKVVPVQPRWLFTLLPEKKFADYRPPDPWLPRGSEIHLDWVDSCKRGKQASCHFGYAGPMTEAMLLGNVALRVGQKIQWDSAKMKATNCPQAEPYINPPYRKGWTL